MVSAPQTVQAYRFLQPVQAAGSRIRSAFAQMVFQLSPKPSSKGRAAGAFIMPQGVIRPSHVMQKDERPAMQPMCSSGVRLQSSVSSSDGIPRRISVRKREKLSSSIWQRRLR